MNNLSASFVSTKLDIMDPRYHNILLFGYVETIICYAVFAFFSLKSLQTTTDDEKDNQNNYYPSAEQEVLDNHHVTIPHQYNAFNNVLIRIASWNSGIPCL
eukprot:UN03117